MILRCQRVPCFHPFDERPMRFPALESKGPHCPPFCADLELVCVILNATLKWGRGALVSICLFYSQFCHGLPLLFYYFILPANVERHAKVLSRRIKHQVTGRRAIVSIHGRELVRILYWGTDNPCRSGQGDPVSWWTQTGENSSSQMCATTQTN